MGSKFRGHLGVKVQGQLGVKVGSGFMPAFIQVSVQVWFKIEA